ncbi:MAG: hypothetical protein CMJ46_02150 [Planctomyces sp.]|nr:hypothetical protein [Planctomyces sp.]
MTLSPDVTQELDHLRGQSFPQTARFTGDKNLLIDLDLTAVEQLSCSLSTLRLTPPAGGNLSLQTLEDWAKDLSTRLTYLLENVSPIEIDPTSQKILVRSSQPSQQGNSKQYYEMLLAVDPQGCLVLRRYQISGNQSNRTAVDLVFTREVLTRLLDDLEESFNNLVP